MTEHTGSKRTYDLHSARTARTLKTQLNKVIAHNRGRHGGVGPRKKGDRIRWQRTHENVKAYYHRLKPNSAKAPA